MKNNEQKIALVVRTPIGTIYRGDVYSVSSINDDGKFDILFGHRGFITLIKDELTIITDKNVTKKLKIDNGLLKCLDNYIEVFLKVSDLPDLQ